MPTRVGAVVVFKDGVTIEQASRWLLQLAGPSGVLEAIEAVPAAFHEFDPRCGFPVWHIPIKGRVAWSEMPQRMLARRAVSDGVEDAFGFSRGSLRRGVWPRQVVRIGYVIHDLDKFNRGRLSGHEEGDPFPTDGETVVRCLEATDADPVDWGFEIVAIED